MSKKNNGDKGPIKEGAKVVGTAAAIASSPFLVGLVKSVIPTVTNIVGTAGAAGAGAMALPAAAIYQAPKHYKDIQNNMQNPVYDTNSAISSYTSNPAPGQQVGTGQNTGTMPEYTKGYRYPYLEHEVTTHDLGGPKDRTNSPGWSPNGDPYRAEDLSSKLSGFFGAPVRGIVNAGLNRYNATRDYMETPVKSTEEPVAVMRKHKGPGGIGKGGVNSQQGAKHMQGNTILFEPAKYGADPTQDLLELEVATGVEVDSPEKVKRLQSHLIDAGYDLGTYGADGKIGQLTLGALRNYMLHKDEGDFQNKSSMTKDIKTQAFRAGELGDTDAFGNKIDTKHPKVGGVLPYESGGEDQDFAGVQMRELAKHLTDETYSVGDERRGAYSSMENKAAAYDTEDYTGADDKDAYEHASTQGNKVYTKDGKVMKAGSQGSKYEDRGKGKGKSKSSGTPDFDSMTFDKAFGAARKLGLKTFPYKGTEIAVKMKRNGGVMYSKK